MKSKIKNDFFQDYSQSFTNNTLGIPQDSVDIYKGLKRVMDVTIAFILLTLTLPVIIIVSILIKLETSGSIFFVQERVGYNGKYFNIIKLRSMTENAEANGAQWAVRNDPRVTKVGRFIRRTRIDELPQLINVLKGEMSIIGPRPERPQFTAQFNSEIPGFIERLKVLPGLTGWAQVNGGYEITPAEKLKLDNYYIVHQNIWLDIKIIFLTIKICLTGSGAR